MAEKKEYVKLWLSYSSYFEPYSDGEVGRLVRAMMKYRESREEPVFTGNERFVWPAIRRDIDESLQAQEAVAAVNRENGKKGGRPPKTEKPDCNLENPENPTGFSESEKSHGQGQGQGQGHGQGQDNAREAVAAVMSAYMDKISPTPSQSSMDELAAYVKSMGAAVCLRAIDEALNAGKANWNYIRGILRSKQSQGVRCLADWDRVEGSRSTVQTRKRTQNLQPSCDRVPGEKALEDMERMRRMMEKMREEEQ